MISYQTITSALYKCICICISSEHALARVWLGDVTIYLTFVFSFFAFFV